MLGGAAAVGAGLLAPSLGRAQVAPRDRKFLFIWADGGWDTSKVFAPVMSSSVYRDPGDHVTNHGGLRIVSNNDRAVVDTFFEEYHSDIVKLDGMLIRSINHPVCRNLWLTNSPNASRPDWPTTIGAAAADRFVVPHMVVAGYSDPGELSAFTCLAGRSGQLDQLVSGGACTRGSAPMLPPPKATSDLVDRFLVERAQQREAESETDIDLHLSDAYRESAERLFGFKSALAEMTFSTDPTITQLDQAVQMLAAGLTRCVTITDANGLKAWDTHTFNLLQNANYNMLFRQLSILRSMMDATPGQFAPTLTEEVVVVVLSEMGRSPYANSDGGKDHWMYTSALMWGPGIAGDRQIGTWDENLNGGMIDLATGETAAKGVAITPDVIGSTLMTLADIDPASVLGTDTTLHGMLGS